MGTRKVVGRLLTCGTDHGYDACHGHHSVVAEWSRSSDVCGIAVDGQHIAMPYELFLELRKVMNEVESVVAEWSRSSDYVRIGVDDKSIAMLYELFLELRKVMNEVDQ